MLFYQVSEDPPGQAAGMADKCKTCGCNCGGQGAKYREQAEEIRKRLTYSSHRIEVMESEFLEIRENLEDELNDTAEELQSLKDKFYRLERSHRSLQRVNQDLEEKLLAMAAQSERTKASLNRDILEMTEKLMNTRLALNQLEEANDRYRKECNLAAQLLQCNPHNFVSPKFSSLPPELQERLQQHMEQVTKNHRKVQSSQSAPGAPMDTVSTAMLAEVLQKPPPVCTVRGVGARREKILFDACVQTNPEDIEQGEGKVIKAKPLRFTAYGVDMGNSRETLITNETGKSMGEWRPIRLNEGQGTTVTSKEPVKVRAFIPVSKGKETEQSIQSKPRQTRDVERPSAPPPQRTKGGVTNRDATRDTQVRLLENVNGNWESREGEEAKKVYSRVVGSLPVSPTKSKKKEADLTSIGSAKGRARKTGPKTEETEPLLEDGNCESSDGADSTGDVKEKRPVNAFQSKGTKSEVDRKQTGRNIAVAGSNRVRSEKAGPEEEEETEPLLEKSVKRNDKPQGRSHFEKVHPKPQPQAKTSKDTKSESESAFEDSAKGKARKTVSVTEETVPLLEKGNTRQSDGSDSESQAKGKRPVSFPQSADMKAEAERGRARKTASFVEESVPLLEDGREGMHEMYDDMDSVIRVKEKRLSVSPQSEEETLEETDAASSNVRAKESIPYMEEKPLIDLENKLEGNYEADVKDRSLPTPVSSSLSESAEMRPEADQTSVEGDTAQASSGAVPHNTEKSPTSVPETKDATPRLESTPAAQQSGARPKSTVKKTQGTKVKKGQKAGVKKAGTKKKVKTVAASSEKQDKDKQNGTLTQGRDGGSDEPESQQHLTKGGTVSGNDKDNSGETAQKVPPKESPTSQAIQKHAEMDTEDAQETKDGAEDLQERSQDKTPEGVPASRQAEIEGREEAPREEEERAHRRRNSLEAAQLSGSLLDF